jgi:DNA-binding MarR family transcriptional regulator/predicted GNAT family acetyltransferase
LLDEGLLDSRFTLTEARVLYELAVGGVQPASAIGRTLDLDAGYLSRILHNFERGGLIDRRQQADRRRAAIRLTEAGEAAFAPLDAASRATVGGLLARLPEAGQDALVLAMARIERLLDSRAAAAAIRPHRPGDIGWLVGRHGALYAAEYGFDPRFEAMVAKVAGGFLETHDPARERCWIAEADAVPLGSVMLVRETETVARLRLLILDPAARGRGIGRALVRTCLDFARAAGYRGVVLWTQEVLGAARQLYREAGFRLVRSEPHAMFGPPMVGEDWELTLG